MDESKEYYFRAYNADDLSFISSSWGKCYYNTSVYSKLMSPQDFHAYHRPIRSNILSSKDCTIIVISAKNDPLLIVAWMCIEIPPSNQGMILHFIYVKEAFRGMGLAKELLAMLEKHFDNKKNKNVMYTHLTHRGSKILKSKQESFSNYYYTPHLILKGD